MTIERLISQVEGIENSMTAFQKKAEEEIKNVGQASADSEKALENLGNQQREVAERLLAIERSGVNHSDHEPVASMGKQFTDSSAYNNFVDGSAQKARFEVQNNTLTGGDSTVAPDRKPGIVGGAFQPLTLESIFPSLPTSSNAIEFTKEASFTNSAAEAAESAEKAESAITWSLVNMPISTVAHWIKISRQLAGDAPALAAYVNSRMVYGVNNRVETQLGAGNGTAPNISGILDTGNFTAHGYAAAALGSTLTKAVLIRKMIADLWAAGYPADAIVMNPADAAQLEIDLFTSTSNAVRMNVNAAGQQTLFGLPIVQAIGMTADNIAVGAFAQAGTIHNREGVIVELSDSDDDNFTKNLVTIRAERRLALAIERPAAILAGDLTPA